MSEQKRESKPANSWPLCPKCGARLFSKGKAVDAGGYKKWAEEWHCPTHGTITFPPDAKDQKSAPD